MRELKNPDMSASYIVKLLMENAKKNGCSYRNLKSGHEAEKIRGQLKYRMKIDDTFDWSGYIVGRKTNTNTHQVAVYVTNSERKLPPELRGGDTFTMHRMDALLRYAVNILCDKSYLGIVALPRMHSYKDAQEYLRRKCKERLGYDVEIIIERDKDSGEYHAKIKRKEKGNG